MTRPMPVGNDCCRNLNFRGARGRRMVICAGVIVACFDGCPALRFGVAAVLPTVEARVAAVLRRRASTSKSAYAFTRAPATEAVSVGDRGLDSSDDWHRRSLASWMMPDATQGDRALLAQCPQNVETLRGLNLPLRMLLADDIGAGAFGENLWLEGPGLGADVLCVGDVFYAYRGDRPSGLELQVASPRAPCRRMDESVGGTFGSGGVSAACARLGLGGWFFRVLQAGDVSEGDVLRLVQRPRPELTLEFVSKVVRGLPSDVSGMNVEADLELVANTPELARFEWRDVAQAKSAGEPANSGKPQSGPVGLLVAAALAWSALLLFVLKTSLEGVWHTLLCLKRHYRSGVDLHARNGTTLALAYSKTHANDKIEFFVALARVVVLSRLHEAGDLKSIGPSCFFARLAASGSRLHLG
eukprot:CAMPEP_0204157942 /NCGR_PEP_ID=MMETSP0361-20130328/31676_1 /ASSEMBLY_ACC=CAM_ASM_000343 /TAXON_ID=268821 /ORGANISM="Scrippsiella Hangoei, Strain SHTV-5" /LENGTH=413 /DNA_ID=CAMNT_0051113795 /DNA_START=1 /DNA_END=1239 /DNA_ORIENTATION=+